MEVVCVDGSRGCVENGSGRWEVSPDEKERDRDRDRKKDR